MESATHPQLLELHRSVSEVTPHTACWPICRTAAGQGPWLTEMVWINNPWRGNAPGYQWVGEGQAGWWRGMQ